MKTFLISAIGVVLCSLQLLLAGPVNLQKAVLIVSPSIPQPMRETAPRMLREEIAKRTATTLNQTETWPKAGGVVIALALSTDAALYGTGVPVRTGDVAERKPEGFRVVTGQQGGNTIVWVIGADARGILFGAGWLLRQLQMDATQLRLPDAADVALSPAYPIRGHQLGYRTTANSYDAWTVAQFEQYIRDLAIFGSNSVEGIPFHEDETPSVHFKIPAAQMRIKMGEICRQYDMDYWVWTPVTFELHAAAKRKAELELHETFYRECPRLDHIFVPGGDPGDNHPRGRHAVSERPARPAGEVPPEGKSLAVVAGLQRRAGRLFLPLSRSAETCLVCRCGVGPKQSADGRNAVPVAETIRTPAVSGHYAYCPLRVSG